MSEATPEPFEVPENVLPDGPDNLEISEDEIEA